LSKKKKYYSPGRVKFYADENIDMGLVDYLREKHKVNIKTANEMGFSGRDDEFHFAEAKRQKRFLLTCDSDFLNHSKFPFKEMVGIVILDVPQQMPGLGWMALWLESEIVPSGKEIYGTKIVRHEQRLDVYWMDETGKVSKETLPHQQDNLKLG